VGLRRDQPITPFFGLLQLVILIGCWSGQVLSSLSVKQHSLLGYLSAGLGEEGGKIVGGVHRTAWAKA
jgi:hypothetical protein